MKGFCEFLESLTQECGWEAVDGPDGWGRIDVFHFRTPSDVTAYVARDNDAGRLQVHITWPVLDIELTDPRLAGYLPPDAGGSR